MKIKRFYTTSPLFEGGRFDEDKPICVFDAPAVFLHMMRCLLDGESDDTPIDESKERTFVSRVNFEIDSEDFELCGVLCRDQSFFIAIDTENGFSKFETKKCLSKLFTFKSDEKNYYCVEHKYVANDDSLSESDFQIANFKRFLRIVKCETKRGDNRPIYIFNFFERIDEAADIIPFIDELASFGRQVFISVSANYPEEKITCDKVQIL